MCLHLHTEMKQHNFYKKGDRIHYMNHRLTVIVKVCDSKNFSHVVSATYYDPALQKPFKKCLR